MPKATIVVPAYNVETTIADTLRSLLAQSFSDFELLVINDGSKDGTLAVVDQFNDPRIRVITQLNRGLAGARNTGIAHACGEYIGFCDSDDLWLPSKLSRHVAHLEQRSEVGISFSGSRMIDDDGQPTGLMQIPKLTGIRASDVIKRNPIGNGSAPVIRRAALDQIAWRPAAETSRDWWFDETFRQSEDIELWTRMALTTDWQIEGVPGLLTLYRINSGGLSANIRKQAESWERMIGKMQKIDPLFVDRNGPIARAYQYRYLCRRAVSMRDPSAARQMIASMMGTSIRPFFAEPVKTLTTISAALVLNLLGPTLYNRTENRLLAVKRQVA